jgi:hypothetical protein
MGSTTLKNCRNPVAPSIRAALRTSSSTPASAALMTRRLKPDTAHTVAPATVIIAQTGRWSNSAR